MGPRRMNNEVIEELKLCPFCGHEAELLKLPETRPFVECRGRRAFDTSGFACGARTGYYSTKAEAIAAWNTRTAYDPDKRLREALEEARNNILTLLGGFRDDMPDAAVKLFQGQAKRIDAALSHNGG
jgi:hypothetical protein